MNKGLELIEAHHLFGVPYDAHRRGGAPAVDRPRARAPERRRLARPPRLSRTCACRSPTRCTTPTAPTCRCARSTSSSWAQLTFEPPDTETFACLRAGPRGRARRAAPRPACSTPPTRWPCTRSSRGELSFPGIAARDRVDARRSCRRGRCATSPTSTRRTPRRARSPGAVRRMSWFLAFVGLRPAGDPARARPLHRRQGRGHAGREVLALLPADAAQQEGGGDRVRDRLDPRGRLREDQRDEPGGGPARRGSRPGLLRPAGVEADRGDRRRARR